MFWVFFEFRFEPKVQDWNVPLKELESIYLGPGCVSIALIMDNP